MPVDVPCTGARSADFPLVLKAWSLTETHVPPRRSQRTGPRGVLGEAPTHTRCYTHPHQVPFGPRAKATSRRALRSVHSIRVTACAVGRLRACRRSGASLSCFPYPSSRGPLRCHSSRSEGYRGPGVRRRGKSGLPAMVLTMTPSPWMIRTTARNRVGNQRPTR